MLERAIRTLQEVARSVYLQAGFAIHRDLWVHSISYAATALSIEGWEKTTGHEFRGPSYVLGQLLWYRSKSADKFKSNAIPGMFLGWRIDNGFSYRGVLKVLDDMLAEKATGFEMYDKEVYLRDAVIFPLADAAEVALANFSSELRLEPIEDVVVPFVDDTPAEARAKARRVYITYPRMLKIGATPGSKGCEESKRTPTSIVRNV